MEHKITTDRLILEPLCEDDISFMKELILRPEAYYYDPEMAETSEDIESDCEWFIQKTALLPDAGGIRWIVKHYDEKIGEVHVHCNWERTLEWELGYHFLKEHWGFGYATEAVRAVIQYVFTNFNINRLAAFTNANNVKSETLLLRVGMIKDGCLREVRLANGVYSDELVYSMLRREFIHTL